MKRFLALALSMLMILGVLLMAGCNTNTPSSTTTGSKNTSGTNGTTAGADNTDGTTDTTTENTEPAGPTGYEKLAGYEDINFGGRVFKIVGADGEAVGDGFDSAKEIYSEESDAISVAVKSRNSIIEQLYGCKIQGVASASPAGDANTEVTSNQHSIDLYTHHYAISGTATGGKAYNLMEYGTRNQGDFSNIWWDQQYVNSYTVKNSAGKDTLYSIVGDFALTTFDCTHAIVYNKTVFQNETKINHLDLYQLVRDKKWTMDQFMFCVKNATHDVDGNSTIDATKGDIAGWIRTGHATHGLHVASGLSILKTTNGTITFDVANNADTWVNVIAKAIEVWAMPEGQTMSYTDIPEAIGGGYALFASEILGSSLGNLKDLENCDPIGLLPYPLYSETQENYAHYVDNHVYSYSIPTSVPDPDTVVDFFNIYAYHSTYIVRPAYISVYAYDYCADQESGEMLDIILSTMTYDPGYLAATFESDLSNMITNGKNNVAQFANKKAANANSWIADFIAGIDKISG